MADGRCGTASISSDPTTYPIDSHAMCVPSLKATSRKSWCNLTHQKLAEKIPAKELGQLIRQEPRLGHLWSHTHGSAKPVPDRV
jgi:hypothetical protein